MIKKLALIALIGLSTLIAGCGIRGDLERPPPLWGEDLRTDEERAHETDDENDG
jgi:predicted small lipoprotein YifL